MVESITIKGDSTQPTPEEQKLKKLVGKMYEKQSVILQPKINSKLKAAVELFFSKPEEGILGKLKGENYTQIRLKSHDTPLYVKVDDLGKALGLSDGELKLLKKEGPKAIAELVEEVAEGLDDSKEGLNAMKDTEKKLTKLSSIYIKALETLHNKKFLSEKRMFAILRDSDFDDVAMQRTIIDIGDKLNKYGKLASGYVRSTKVAVLDEKNVQKTDQKGAKLFEKQTYAYNVTKQGEIDIHTKLLGKGASTKAKVGTNLQTGEKEALLTIKDDQKEFNSIQKNLKTLKEKGIRNTPTVHKYTYEVKTKNGQTKYVLGQELYTDGTKLKALPMYHALNALKDTAEGYADLHDYNLIHSDIKPNNISLKGDIDSKQAVKGIINDFGTLSTSGNLGGGTLEYLPPEILTAKEERDALEKVCEERKQKIRNLQIAEKSFKFDYTNETTMTESQQKLEDLKGIKEIEELKLNIDEQKLNRAYQKLHAAATEKYDSFCFGVTLFEIASGRVFMQNGKIFATAKKGSEIQTEIDTEIDLLNKSIDKTSSKDKIDDALMRINLLKIAMQLLEFDPKTRLTCKEAAKLLQVQCDMFSIEPQKLRQT